MSHCGSSPDCARAISVSWAGECQSDLSFLKKVGSAIRGGGPVPPVASPPRREIGAYPSGWSGWSLAALGVMLLIASSALYAAAASRRRRAYRTFP